MQYVKGTQQIDFELASSLPWKTGTYKVTDTMELLFVVIV